MPADIIFVHDDKIFLEHASAALRASGHQVACSSDSMDALALLETAERAELLITRVNFRPGTPNGVALARMARRKRRGIMVLFVAQEEMREYTDGAGELLPVPVGIPDLVDTVWGLLDQSSPSPSQLRPAQPQRVSDHED
jgi:DNA-binding NtrC family response regulator